MVQEMLAKLPGDETPLRLVFFGNPDNNGQYLEQRKEILRQVAEKYGGIEMPLVSYVAQKPVDSALVMESQWANVDTKNDKEGTVLWTRKMHKRTNYIVAENRKGEGKWLFTEGILPASLDYTIEEQSDEVLGILGGILAKEGMNINSIVRQWNYIEQITCVKGGKQHYQEFNDSRSEFYALTKWKDGYPAATGIGTKLGGIMVEADAMLPTKKKKSEVVPLDNELQVAAHVYSQGVLIGEDKKKGKTTPKFERAKAVVLKHRKEEDDAQVYISGTAAIRGEESLTGVGIEQQTVITLENIEFLISKQNLKKHGVKVEKEAKIKNFRVYLKTEDLFETAQKVILERYPEVPALYVLTDVCRDELLIEIEGVAQTW